MLRARIARVSQHFDDDILDTTDIVFRLAPLGLGNTKANVALAEILLDAKATLATH